MTVGLLSFVSNLTKFNGGLKQTGNPNTGAPGMYIFTNFIKGAAVLQWDSIPTDPTYTPFGLEVFMPVDANGYPTSVPTGAGNFGTNFTIPNATQYAGKWVLKWDGTGTAGMRSFPFTPGPGFSGISSSTGRFEFFNNDTGVQWTSASFFCSATAASPNHLKNLRLCRSIDEAAMDAGQVFFPDHLTLMKSAKPGAIRSLGWGGESDGTNTSLIGLWSQRRPVGYVNYRGYYYNPNLYGGVTTHSGIDYSLTYAGFTLIDKALIHLVWDASVANRTSQNVTVAWSTTSGSAIVVNRSSHGYAVGNTMCFGNSGLPAGINVGQQYFVSNVIDANNFNISATSGGASINATATTSGSWTIAQMPRLSINGGSFINLTDFQTPTPTNIGSICGVSPQAGLSTIIYDQTTNWWHISRTGAGLMVGGPPETFIDFCAAVGANPWITAPFMTQTTGGALGGVTDYMTSWVTYAKNTYSWMKPLIEPYNETWNPTLAGLGTFYASTLAYSLWPTAGSNRAVDEAYGKWVSDLGQAMSAIYGNDRTKYSMLCMTQGSTLHDPLSLNINDPRLVSGLYVSVSSGQPAYKFCDRVGAACYYAVAQSQSVAEMQAAFNYYITNAGNPTGQLAVAETYAALALTSSEAFANLPFVKTVEGNIKNWGLGLNGNGSTVPTSAGGNTVKGMCMYEGGWGPESVLAHDNFTTPVATSGNITNANPCILTLGPNNTSASGGFQFTGNPGVAGMMVNLSGVSGMTQINNAAISCSFSSGSASIASTNSLIVNQAISFPITFGSLPSNVKFDTPYYIVAATGTTLQISATRGGTAIVAAGSASCVAQPGWFVTAVGTSTITLDVDSTAFGAWTSGGTVKWTSNGNWTVALRIGSLLTTAMGVNNTQMYTDFFSFGGGGFTAEYPSNFIYFGNAGAWAVLQPNIYASLTPCWNSIVAQQ